MLEALVLAHHTAWRAQQINAVDPRTKPEDADQHDDCSVGEDRGLLHAAWSPKAEHGAGRASHTESAAAQVLEKSAAKQGMLRRPDAGDSDATVS